MPPLAVTLGPEPSPVLLTDAADPRRQSDNDHDRRGHRMSRSRTTPTRKRAPSPARWRCARNETGAATAASTGSFTASDNQGGECLGSAPVSVPPDQATAAIDSAPPSYDSFGPTRSRSLVWPRPRTPLRRHSPPGGPDGSVSLPSSGNAPLAASGFLHSRPQRRSGASPFFALGATRDQPAFSRLQ